VSKINKKIEKIASIGVGSKRSAMVGLDTNNVEGHVAVEKKLKVAKNAVQVVSRRSRRGQMKSTETVAQSQPLGGEPPSSTITEDKTEL
jgi:hypothetical protein